MNTAEIAKQICQELGIAWDEKATVATLKGEPVDASVVYSSFFSNVVSNIPVSLQATSQEYSITTPKPLLAA